MRYDYTAILEREPGTDHYQCSVPDIPGCFTSGDGLDDALKMVRDAASLLLVSMEDENKPVPAATPQDELDIPKGAVVTILQIDTIKYRKKLDSNLKKISVTLPKWMVDTAKARGLNCSGILKDGLMAAINA